MVTHTVEKPFKCNQCEESFVFEGQLNMHMHNHTEEKLIDESVADWVGKTSFADMIKSPPKHMASTPKITYVSQPCRPVEMEKSSQKPKRCMSTSPEIVQENNKIARYARESFLKKPASQPVKHSNKGKK